MVAAFFVPARPVDAECTMTGGRSTAPPNPVRPG